MRRRYLLAFLAILAAVGLGTLIVVTRPDQSSRWSAPPRPTPSASPLASAGSPATTAPAPPVTTATPAPASPRPSREPTAPGLPARLLGVDLEAIPTARPVVALTFDAGANADGLPAILSTLAAQHISGTFFLTGDFAARYPAAVRQIVAGGHRIANHSTTHPRFTGLTNAGIRDQLATAESAIRAAGGPSPRPLFRFPYGDRDARTIATVNAAGYTCVRWTVDTLGWKGTSGSVTAQVVVNRAVGAARPGEIVLMHIGSNPDDHSTLDADALPAVISGLRGHGYGFVTLDALL